MDPEGNSYSALSTVNKDKITAKPALIISDLIKAELETIDNNIPDVYNLIEKRANEYLKQVKPSISESFSGLAGTFRLTLGLNSDFNKQSKSALNSVGYNQEHSKRIIDGL